MELVHHLEELGANAFPAGLNQQLDGWLLRATSGQSRGLNSVLPNRDNGYHSPAEKLALVETFYRQQGQSPRFHISPAAQPTNLDELLDERGYGVTFGQIYVQVASIATILNQAHPKQSVTYHEQMTPAWLAAYRQISHHSEGSQKIRQAAWQRIPCQTAFALATFAGIPAGIGLGVYERGWVGIYSMSTRPEYRRQGIATSIINTLANWGQEQQARQMYLHVFSQNQAGLATYGRLGFNTLYQFYYREKKAE